MPKLVVRIFMLFLAGVLLLGAGGLRTQVNARQASEKLLVGFGQADITPSLEKTVYMAGFGQNRKATKIHDPLKARAVVLAHGGQKIAIVSIDVVGFFYPNVLNVRKQLPGFNHVLVSSTHNHEGPDTLGLWGPDPFRSGIDPAYMQMLETKIVTAVRAAESAAVPATARVGMATAPDMLHDGREPYVKHDELVAIRFVGEKKRDIGIVVQWNCHPETLSSKNTEISADFVGPAVEALQKIHNCPVVYLTGTVGGLMTSLHVPISDESGKSYEDGTFEKNQHYGLAVARIAENALNTSKPAQLTPLEVRTRELFIPMQNKLYQVGRQLGVLNREAFLWTGDPSKAEPADAKEVKKPVCIRTEVGLLRLGELEIAAIPGEIYPELVLDKVQDPVDPGADFPQAPIEPAIYKQLRGPYRMIIGLANDEIGYIIPKRQWDEKPPFCYGRQKTQYGEVNSIGPDAAPILCNTFKELAGK